MKQIFSLLLCCTLFLLTNYTSQCQTVTIICNAPSCELVEPLQPITYSFGVTGVPSGYAIASRSWSVSRSDAASPSTGSSATFSTVWNNVSNIPPINLTLTVTLKKTGSPNIVKTATLPITILSIGGFGPMTIAGSTPSTLSEGQTGSLGCGVLALVVTIPTPVIIPAGTVTYSWTYPPGWSGPATTTVPAVLVTTTAGTGGVISVIARRTDWLNYFLVFSANLTRRVAGLPTITGPTNLCIGSSATFSATSNFATSVVWSTSAGVPNNGSGLTINSGQNTFSVQASGSGSGTGVARITAVSNNACLIPATSTKQVNVGAPYLSSNTVNGNPSQSINIVPSPSQLSTMSPNATSFNWSVLSGSGSILPNGPNCNATFNSFFSVKVTANNTCGAGDSYIYNLQKIGGMGVFPNPASNVFAINFEDPSDMAENFEGLVLRSDKMEIVKSINMDPITARAHFATTDQLSIDVSSLPRGRYYLTVFIAGKPYGETIILK